MNHAEVAKLIGFIGFLDARIQIDEGKVLAWHTVLLNSMSLEEAQWCVSEWYKAEDKSIMPANINSIWRKEKNRLAQVNKEKELDAEIAQRRKIDPKRIREIREFASHLAIENGEKDETAM